MKYHHNLIDLPSFSVSPSMNNMTPSRSPRIDPSVDGNRKLSDHNDEYYRTPTASPGKAL